MDHVHEPHLVSRRGRGWVVIILVAIVVAGAVALIGRNDEPQRPMSGARANTATGTSGTTPVANAIAAADYRSRIGERVTIRVPARDLMNDVAFWAGSGEEQILVVMNRDRRSGEERQQGLPAPHGIKRAEGLASATISGVIEPVPDAEATYSWALTRADRVALGRAGAYLRAESVIPDTGASAHAEPVTPATAAAARPDPVPREGSAPAAQGH
jgi:hypothetical protein